MIIIDDKRIFGLRAFCVLMQQEYSGDAGARHSNSGLRAVSFLNGGAQTRFTGPLIGCGEDQLRVFHAFQFRDQWLAEAHVPLNP